MYDFIIISLSPGSFIFGGGGVGLCAVISMFLPASFKRKTTLL